MFYDTEPKAAACGLQAAILMRQRYTGRKAPPLARQPPLDAHRSTSVRVRGEPSDHQRGSFAFPHRPGPVLKEVLAPRFQQFSSTLSLPIPPNVLPTDKLSHGLCPIYAPGHHGKT